MLANVVHVKELLKPCVHNAGWLVRVHLWKCAGRYAMQVVSCKYCGASSEKLAWKVQRFELWSGLQLIVYDLHKTFAHAFLWVDLCEPTYTVYAQLLTVFNAACPSIKFVSGLGSRSSPSSLLPHPRYEHTVHHCLPLNPATPLTFLTWLRRRNYGCNGTYSWPPNTSFQLQSNLV
jgi:hypothetical protein